MTDYNHAKKRWSSRPGRDGVKEYWWGTFRVWREWEGQWWLSSEMLGDDLGPFGSSIKAKDWAVHIVISTATVTSASALNEV